MVPNRQVLTNSKLAVTRLEHECRPSASAVTTLNKLRVAYDVALVCPSPIFHQQNAETGQGHANGVGREHGSLLRHAAVGRHVIIWESVAFAIQIGGVHDASVVL
nr:hypothetical protein CFP56_65901 [Quercus suber]